MGTTLQNGVYLPNEGERNCYAGLKTNWEILDQKVADVTALQQAVAGALHREIVESLPTTDINPNTIYMILSGTSATENVYDEFMYVNNAWELIGTSATDLTNYYTKGEVDGLLLLKANASDLTSHTGDTTIHVTASDKTKWTNSANTHVLRLALSALTPSTSDNSFSNLDDSTALKVGDKVMDTAGVLFEVTAIDTQNSTFTIGTSLIDLAQDSDVVHKSGNETISGVKTITDTNLEFKSTSAEYGVSAGDSSVIFKDKNNLQTFKIYSRVFSSGLDNNLVSFFLTQKVDNTYYISNGIQLFANTGNKNAILRPILANNNADGLSISLGDSNRRWQSIYANNYYYGNDNVEFSTKFVTTDTAQTVSGAKTFSSSINLYNSDSTGNVSNIVLKNSKAEVGTEFAEQSINFIDKNNNPLAKINCYGSSGNYTRLYITVSDSNNNSDGIFIRKSLTGTTVLPTTSSTVWLGNSDLPFYNVQTKRVNGITPSSLSLPVAPSSTSYVDISGYITVLDSSAPNTYTPPSNGYITFSVTGNLVQIFHDYGLQGKWTVQTGNANRGFIPVLGGVEVKIYITASNVDKFWFIPCQGNI